MTDAYDRADGSDDPAGPLLPAPRSAEYLDPDEILEITKQGFAFFERAVRPCPTRSPSTTRSFVPEFNAGAMENAGCVTFREDYVFRSKVTDARRDARANTILHEMAHMWFGDLVTMRWWDDLWLNESFAEFMAYHSAASRRPGSPTPGPASPPAAKAWGYRQDQLPSTHPIVADAPDIETVKANFDGITYAKGASVLASSWRGSGSSTSWPALRAYFAKHAWGNTTLADLLVELEATVRSRPGRVVQGVAARPPAATRCARSSTSPPTARTPPFAVAQEAPGRPPDAALAPHRDRPLRPAATATLVRRRRVEIDVVGARTEVPELVGERAARPAAAQRRRPHLRQDPPGRAVARDVTLRPRPRSTAPWPRALCWSAAWDMTRDAEMRAARLRRARRQRRRRGDRHRHRADRCCAQAQSALDLYVRPGHRDASRTALATALRALVGPPSRAATTSSPSSGPSPASRDRRRGPRFLQASSTAAHVLDGLSSTPSCAGPCCAAWSPTGRADDAAIDAELARDTTASGQRHAATARAARPTADAKAEAWAAVVEHDELPNALQTATIGGFIGPRPARAAGAVRRPLLRLHRPGLGDPHLRDGHQHRDRPLPGAVRRPGGGRPHERLPRHQEPAAVLARLLAEGRSGVERALRAQAADA